ncbi:MAG TPA: MFS transporter [Longimicrobiaceae bacterium]|nr:MFS transporter [Longimicrobiaceae bacterium]
MPVRRILIGVTFTLSMLLYVDRIAISTAQSPINGEFGLSDTQFGWILSAFALGYALFQTPAGIVADRYGPRVVIAAIVALWSLFTLATGLAWGFVSLLVFRFLFGAAEAGAYPSVARTFYSWLPTGERGLAQGINFSGSRLGAAFALPVVAWLVTSVGWRMAFFILGAIGIVWAFGWYVWFRNTPEEHPGVTAPELALIEAGREAERASEAGALPLRLGDLGRSRNMWLVMGQYFASNFTFFFCLTWLFPYLQRTYDLGAVQAGFFASAPLIAGAIGNWVGGAMVDSIYRSGRLRMSRQLPAMLGFSLAAIGLLGSLQFDDPVFAVLFLSIAIFGADMTLPPSWAFCIDIGRSHAGTVSGTMNMAGNLGSFVTSLAFPYLMVITGSTNLFFLVGAALNIIAVFLWWRTDATRPITPTGVANPAVGAM